jgi:hypothetical protein
MAMQYRPLTESFREINRMLIEKQSWDADAKNRQAQMGLQNIMVESQLKTAQQQQQMNDYKLQEQERLNTPNVVNIGNFMPDNEIKQQFFASPEGKRQLVDALIDEDPTDWEISEADMSVTNTRTGEKRAMSMNDMKNRMGFIYGIIDANTDQVAAAHKRLGSTTQMISEMDSEIAKAKKSKYTHGQLIELHKERVGLKEQQTRDSEFLTPKSRLAHYDKKIAQFSRRAMFLDGIGATDAAKLMSDSGNKISQEKLMYEQYELGAKKDAQGVIDKITLLGK